MAHPLAFVLLLGTAHANDAAVSLHLDSGASATVQAAQIDVQACDLASSNHCPQFQVHLADLPAMEAALATCPADGPCEGELALAVTSAQYPYFRMEVIELVGDLLIVQIKNVDWDPAAHGFGPHAGPGGNI